MSSKSPNSFSLILKTIISLEHYLPLFLGTSSLSPPPLLLPTQQLDSASSNTCGSDSAWFTSPQWLPITCPIPCIAWDLGSLPQWSPFSLMMASAQRDLFLNTLPPANLGCFHISSLSIHPFLFPVKDSNSNPFLWEVLLDLVSSGLASLLCVPFFSHSAITILDWTK